MLEGITRAEQNLLLLQSLIPASERFYIWCYDARGGCIASSCPDDIRPALDEAFRVLGGLGKALAYAAQPDADRPRIIGSAIGMQWAATFETERSRSLIFVAGPVFYAPPSEKQVLDALYIDASSLAPILAGLLPRLPVMSYAVFSRYVMMVHNTLTGKQLGLEALEDGAAVDSLVAEAPAGARDRVKVYMAEKALLEMVRAGDINYQSAFQNSVVLSPGVPVQGRDPLRQMKTSIIVFTTLVCRAAMEGGLSPEIAYSLGDSYIQTAEDCRDSGELSALAYAMYHDFIYRVHHLRANPNYSHAIQKCCDYIELSLDRRVRAADLAALAGYTEYYLTEKFKKETGKSVSAYIRDAKLTRARVLLETTALPVAEIAERLAFNTPNYFIQCFKSAYRRTPAQYRKEAGQGSRREACKTHVL